MHMEKVKHFIANRFEQLFVFIVLATTAAISLYTPHKLAFLNIYFLPVILAGYYLGTRTAALGALFSILMVMISVFVQPELFFVEPQIVAIYGQVAVWAGFLILAGVVVGSLNERLHDKIFTTERLNKELVLNQQELSLANAELKDQAENLENRVKERTAELELSRNAIDTMKQKVENALYATMDPVVVNMMIEGKLRNEKRNVSVMFSDLVNFSGYSEDTAPEVVISDLNRYLQDMEPIISSFHGHIDKYMGDGIMCEFGAPVSFSTFRTMAVVSAMKMQQQVRRKNYPWEMRVGIATGAAFTGIVGNKRQTYTAIGDAVNLAARLEKACPTGGILIDRTTYDAVAYCVEVRRQRGIGVRQEDLDKEAELDELLNRLDANAGDGDLLFRIAQHLLDFEDPKEALKHLEKALILEPANTAYKLLYAEAGLKSKEMERISVKGKRRRVEAFQVLGFKNPLCNPEKIPLSLQAELNAIAKEQIKIPDDLILPVEVLDDSVGRSQVVAALSYLLAGALGLSEKDKQDVLHAAFLSDIGKESIPAHLFQRSNALSSGEQEIYRQHPLEGVRILRKLGYENPAMLDMVANAHENWEGGGYPSGISGAAIPLGSRIIAVADTYDALTSKREYRQSWERSAALDEILREAGLGRYDVTVASAFAQLFRAL